MRVSDLIPWKQARGSEPAVRNERDPVAALQSDVNRAFADFLRMVNLPHGQLARRVRRQRRRRAG